MCGKIRSGDAEGNVLWKATPLFCMKIRFQLHVVLLWLHIRKCTAEYEWLVIKDNCQCVHVSHQNLCIRLKADFHLMTDLCTCTTIENVHYLTRQLLIRMNGKVSLSVLPCGWILSLPVCADIFSINTLFFSSLMKHFIYHMSFWSNRQKQTARNHCVNYIWH